MIHFRSRPRLSLYALGLLAVLVMGLHAAAGLQVQAQAEPTPETVAVTGTLEGLMAGNGIIVNGTVYTLGPGVPLPTAEQLGQPITINIVTDPNTQTVIVIGIIVPDDDDDDDPPAPGPTAFPTLGPVTPFPTDLPIPTLGPVGTILPTDFPVETEVPGATAESTPDDRPIIIIEGPVQTININIITIYDINVFVEPNHPFLTLIAVGDLIRIEGFFEDDDFDDDGLTLIAVNLGNVVGGSLADGLVELEGPVQAIEGSIVVINNIRIQINPEDPFWRGVDVGEVIIVNGNFVNIQGDFYLTIVNVYFFNPPAPPPSGGNGGGGNDDDDDDDDGGGRGRGRGRGRGGDDDDD